MLIKVVIVVIAAILLQGSSAIEVTSTPVGWANIPNPPGYEYGPTIILENAVYYSFFCSSGPGPTGGWDVIRMVTSSDGVNWSSPQDALDVGNGYDLDSVCDPSVVKFHGVYYMYHTCINQASPPDGYTNNRICVATADSIQGPYRKVSAPVIQDLSCTSGSLYCVGQPSAVAVNGTIYVWYTNQCSTDQPGPNPGYIYLQTSKNGVDFTPANNGNPVFSQRDVDVKYERSSQSFFMIQGDVGDSHIAWSVSKDGVNWLPYDLNRTLNTNPDIIPGGSNNNPGIAGEPSGSFSGQTWVAYGSSYRSGAAWHLYRTDIVVNPDQNNCICDDGSCDLNCSQLKGVTMWGTCKYPNQSNPIACCECDIPPQDPDCSACAPEGCGAACVGAGYQTGTCGTPGSSNPSDCCSCFN